MNNTQDQQACDVICRSHSARTERDLYRVCPSKLSKRELENVYFALLENNLELKKTLHSQQEKLKVLSTKVQRMTAVQRNAAGKERDCCGSKALVNEQKEMMFELKETNNRMAERIRLLNMRLCSAKQFLKRSPSQMSKCPKCARCPTAPGSFKNSSMSALIAKQSEASVKANTVSSQYIAKDAPQSPKLTQPVGTENEPEKEDMSERQCTENKCRTLMDELQQKIVHLQEELSNTHSEYSKRISKLETDVSGLHNENVRVRSDVVASEHAILQRESTLREARGTINDLTMQLTIERRKVTELKTNLKLANMSSQTAKTIENINNLQQEKLRAETDGNYVCPVCSFCSGKRDKELAILPEQEMPLAESILIYPESDRPSLVHSACVVKPGVEASPIPTTPPTTPEKEIRSPATSLKPKEDSKLSKSDDSGYTDLNRSCETDEDKAMEKLNHDLLVKRIVELQTQLDGLRIQSAGEPAKSPHQQKSNYIDNYEAVDDHKIRNPIAITIIEERPNFVLEIEGLNEKQFNALAEKDMETSTPIKEKEYELWSNNDRRDANLGVPSKDPMVEGSTEGAEHTSIEKSGRNGTRQNKLAKIETPNSDDDASSKDATYNKDVITDSVPALNPKIKDKKKSPKNSKNKSKEIDKINETNKVNNSYDDAQCTTSKDNAKKMKATYKENNLYDIAQCITNKDSGVRMKANNKENNLNDDTQGTTSKEYMLAIEDQSYVKPKLDQSAIERKETPKNENSKQNNIQDYKGKSVDVRAEKLDIGKIDGKLESNRPGTSLNQESEVIVDPIIPIPIPDKELTNEGVVKPDPTQIANNALLNKEGAHSAENARPKEAESVNVEESPVVNKLSESAIRPFCNNQDSSNMFKDISSNTNFDDGIQLHVDDPTPTSAPPPRRDSATYSAAPAPPARRPSATYTRSSPPRLTPRAASPENTDHEISSLSDLPPERDDKSSRDALSPGEAKATMTTETETGRTTDYGSLSEGELPAPDRDTRPRKLSFGEKATYCDPETSSAQMEATLHAISEELMRCRMLLASARKHEAGGGGGGAALRLHGVGGGGGAALRLHGAGGARRLGGARAPSAVFTLHLGTLVLSDEAVMNSRDKSLVMMWRFFDQSVTMTRMRDGRVVLFDFSTEYDVAYNDNFMKYMRQEEMPIVICELNRPDEPFASCSLPLRDTLLHINRRTDMSLALVAGPAMSAQRGAAADELGALDLWCVLRYDSGLRDAGIRNSSSLPSREQGTGCSRQRAQATEGERLNASQDLALVDPREEAARRSRIESRMWAQLVPSYPPQPSPVWTTDQGTSTSRIMDENDADYDTLREYYRQSSQTGNLFPESVSRLHPDSLEALLKKGRKFSGATPRSSSQQDGTYIGRLSSKDENDPALAKKYSNINNIIGLNKLAEAAKKTVKYNDEVDDPPYSYSEEPVKESADRSQEQSIAITVVWLALHEECEAMRRPAVRRLYVAYSFLGRRGRDLETPVALPKPQHYADKCYFNFKKTFHLHEAELPLLAHLSRRRRGARAAAARDCVVFAVVSEPPEDVLGLSSCEDIGYGYLYLGDILAYSAGGSGYTDVIPVHAARAGGAACGVLAVRVDGLHVLRRCLATSRAAC